MIGRRKKRHDLPLRVYHSKGWYFWVDPRDSKWHKLGKEWDMAARMEWARLTGEDYREGLTVTVQSMLTAFTDAREKEGKRAARTIADYRDHAVQLCRIFGKMGPNDLTSAHIAQYLERRVSPNGVPAPVRANREISTLSSAYAWAMRQGLAERNPCYGVRRNREDPEQYAPELWEVRAVQKHASPKWAAAIGLALLVGQRGVDMRKLKRNDATEDGIYFQQTKRGARILIEWDDELRAAWAALEHAMRKSRTPSIYMIPAKSGQPFSADGWKSSFSKIVGRALDAGDIPTRFGFHSIRAANATIEDEQGGKPQKRLGHRTEAQTADYIRRRRPTKVKALKVRGVSGTRT